MKKCKRVTEENLSTILGHIKNWLSGKEFIHVTSVYRAKTLKKANQLFNGRNNQSVSVSPIDVNFIVAKAKIENNFLFPKPFITIRNHTSTHIIDVDDQIKITGNQVVLFKGKYCEQPPSVEFWEIK